VLRLSIGLVCVASCKDSDDGDPNTADDETFAHQYAEATCEFLDTCISTGFTQYYTGMDDCISYLEDYGLDAGCDFDDDMERNCLDEIDQATSECNAEDVSNPDQICAAFLSGCST
jgi:hypothetical protein